ncbi:Malate dehydrogenase, cytoplasmic [Goodea atripinnis]|uniref:Malate dehydrogenase n=1 Tax=Goodea atripinnis TaxID=208336 RepID=A0ABV0N258_9TELE
MLPVLDGVVMELQDCALPLLRGCYQKEKQTIQTHIASIWAALQNCCSCTLEEGVSKTRLLIGWWKEGMERKDLLKANVAIFKTQGAALDKYAKKTVKVLVVGNPANTNCLIASKSAPSIPKENFSCLTRLDHNRACSQVAMRCGVSSNNVKNVIIWGNHSSTQYPDVHHAKVNVGGAEKAAYDAVKNDAWLRGDFISTVQQRGAAVIKARKLSSAMSAAKAICDHMRDIWFGTKEGEFISMGVYATGNSYGIPEDLIYSFPIQIKSLRHYLPAGEGSRWRSDRLSFKRRHNGPAASFLPVTRLVSDLDLTRGPMTEFEEKLRQQHEDSMHRELEALLATANKAEAEVGKVLLSAGSKHQQKPL